MLFLFIPDGHFGYRFVVHRIFYLVQIFINVGVVADQLHPAIFAQGRKQFLIAALESVIFIGVYEILSAFSLEGLRKFNIINNLFHLGPALMRVSLISVVSLLPLVSQMILLLLHFLAQLYDSSDAVGQLLGQN